MAEEKTPLPHKLSLSERNRLSVTGVRDVISFDEQTVALHTDLGTLHIHGKDLQLRSLSPESALIVVEGSIGAMIYEEPLRSGSLWKRLFR